MNSVIFIADFFADQIPGGGELNNEELINILGKRGCIINKTLSHTVNPEFVEENSNQNFIVANFANLNTESKEALYNKKYIIYEHDHKYLPERNPSLYEGYVAPPEKIINFDFYKNAAVVICQSQFHENIVRNNLSSKTSTIKQ